MANAKPTNYVDAVLALHPPAPRRPDGSVIRVRAMRIKNTAEVK